MKHVKIVLLTLILVAIFAQLVVAGEPTLDWSNTFGGTKSDDGLSVVETRDGGYIITGETSSFGAGRSDVYLVKTDSSGKELWSKTFGGTKSDSGYSVVETGDGGYIITGETYSFSAGGTKDVYLVKTDSSGKELWSKTFGGTDRDGGFSVVETGDGGYIITGDTWSFGAGSGDVYLVKTDSSGKELWSKTFGGTKSDSGYSVVETGDGGYIITGETSSFGAGRSDVYLVKTDSSGKELWSKTFGGTDRDGGLSVVETGDGGYIIAGWTESFGRGINDVYLVKTDSSGKELWSKTFGGTGYDRGFSVVETGDGGYIITGQTSSFGAGSGDVYLVKTDSSGKELWSKTFGGTRDDYGRSVVETRDGGYIITGGTWSFGTGGSSLGNDVYLVKLMAETITTTTLTTPPTAAPPTPPPQVTSTSPPETPQVTTAPPQTKQPPSTPTAPSKEDDNNTLLLIVAATILGITAVGAYYWVKKPTKPQPQKVITPASLKPSYSTAIEVSDLVKKYRNSVILENVSFTVPPSILCSIVGLSGGGKSTIIEAIAGRIPPDSGKVTIAGKDADKNRMELNKIVGFVPQHPELNLDQTVWQNLMNSSIKWEVKEAGMKSTLILKQLGILGRKEVVAKNLSGGQLKRLSLAMELIREPEILILDEPTTGLDPTSRDQILTALTKIVTTNKKTVLFTTHFMDEAEHCDEVIVIGDAKVLAKGSPSQLARKLPGMGKIVIVTLEEVSETLVKKLEKLPSVKKVIREGRVLKIISDKPDPVELSQRVKELGGTVEKSEVKKAGMKEVFVYFTGKMPEE